MVAVTEDANGEDVTLTGARELLERIGTTLLIQAMRWCEFKEAHGDDDERALREGWRSRLTESLRRIEQNAILRAPKRVSDLIRGDERIA